MEAIKWMVEKYRHELKFIYNELDLKLLENRISVLMKPDKHADENGEYLIRSVYFDDIYRKCFYENENGVDPREKFRIRIYNCSTDRISLEKKSKKKGMTGKEACSLDIDICDKLLRGENINQYYGRHPLLDEFIRQRNQRLLKPVMLGEYVRTPYVYSLGNVRVTFDRNIAASARVTQIFERQIPKISVLPTACHILEVKYDDFLPDIIAQIVNNGHSQQSSFSKFYLGCKAIGGRI